MSRNALHCSAILLHILIKSIAHNVIETKFPKLNWGTISEQNSGHTPNEWGPTKEKPKNSTIFSYTVNWTK